MSEDFTALYVKIDYNTIYIKMHVHVYIYVYSIYAFICKVYTHVQSIISLLINSKLFSTFEFH